MRRLGGVGNEDEIKQRTADSFIRMAIHSVDESFRNIKHRPVHNLTTFDYSVQLRREGIVLQLLIRFRLLRSNFS